MGSFSLKHGSTYTYYLLKLTPAISLELELKELKYSFKRLIIEREIESLPEKKTNNRQHLIII